MARSSSKRNSASRLGQLGLADAGRAEEQEGAGGPVGIGDAGAGAAYRIRHGAYRLRLTDQPLPDPGLHRHQLLGLALQQPADRYAGPVGDHLGNVVRADLLRNHRGQLTLVLGGLLQLLLQGRNLAVVDLTGLDQVAFPKRPLGSHAQLVDLLLQLADAVEALLLRLPARLEGPQLLLDIGQFLGQPMQAARRCRGRTPSPARVSASASAPRCGAARRSPPARSRSPSAVATPPHRPGRSPCPAACREVM